MDLFREESVLVETTTVGDQEFTTESFVLFSERVLQGVVGGEEQVPPDLPGAA